MSDALYGLLGGIGGAFITAVGAYFGPLQVERRRLQQQRQENADARAELRRQTDEQRELEATREALAVARNEGHASVERCIKIRTETRAWSQLLGRYIQDLAHGREIVVSDFDADLENVRGAAQSALDNAIHDGLWVPQRSSSFGPGSGRSGRVAFMFHHADPVSRRRIPPNPVRLRTSSRLVPARTTPTPPVITSLDKTTQAIRSAILGPQPCDQASVERLWRALDQVEAERASLNAVLHELITQPREPTHLDATN